MAEVKILIEGYTSEKAGKGRTCPTITLVKDGEVIMIVDPGVLKDQGILINALKKEGLDIGNINFVCITHSHLDHYRNIGMFPKAKSLDYWGIWYEDRVEDWEEDFRENIKIIKTPGHSYDGITLLVKTKEGIVAIVGDVFWEKYAPKEDPYATDKEKLKESRKKVLEAAKFIIPGHGAMFKV
jgi:glyoxylase-like metal-dependent hydrolase (beta-lactamase superfamily II)